MIINKPSVIEIKQSYRIKQYINNLYKKIEFCGRTCYKSLNYVKRSSAKKFVDMLIKNKHGAMLEHGAVYLVATKEDKDYAELIHFYFNDKYSKIYFDENLTIYITTNFRVVAENNRFNDLTYISKPTKYHAKRRTFRIICDRGVSHEFVRHRVFSFAQESQRYCNYAKDKFDNQITFIEPLCFYDKEANNLLFQTWLKEMSNAEAAYMQMIKLGCSAEYARSVLPNSTKTELIMTGYEEDWQHFFELRRAKSAHPQAKEIADMIYNLF